jgi:hypothetical protein
VRSVPVFPSVDAALRELAARTVERDLYAPDELVFATIRGTPLHESNGRTSSLGCRVGRSSRHSATRSVEELQQLVSDELDLLVAPLRSPVVAGDQAGAVQATEVPVDECVARLGLV